MKAMINRTGIQGIVYQHTLEVKTVKSTDSANFGKEFIGGQIDIVVDDEIV